MTPVKSADSRQTWGATKLFWATQEAAIRAFRALPSTMMAHSPDGFLVKDVAFPDPAVKTIAVILYQRELPPLPPSTPAPAPVTAVAAAAAAAAAAPATPIAATPLRVLVVRGAVDSPTPGKPRGVIVTGEATAAAAVLASAAGFAPEERIIITDADGDVVAVPGGLVAGATYYVDAL
jgi:hypothetical protein